MDFNHFLTSYMPDPTIGSKTHFKNMLDQSVLADIDRKGVIERMKYHNILN